MDYRSIIINKDKITQLYNIHQRYTSSVRTMIQPQYIKHLDTPVFYTPQELLEHRDELKQPYNDMPAKDIIHSMFTPPYHEGEILYVKETWNYGYFATDDPFNDIEGNDYRFVEVKDPQDKRFPKELPRYIYAQNFTEKGNHIIPNQKFNYGLSAIKIPWKPSIYMPKEAARLWVRVMSIRAQQVKDMTYCDATQEGYYSKNDFVNTFFELHPEYDENVWLWAIELKACGKPKDAEEE